ncbi:MAG: hypothetical protein Kow0031_35640 [Anaerolineae bacterium]
MPRIKTGQRAATRTWEQTIVDRIRTGKVVPLISNVVSNDLVLGGHHQIVESYATYSRYPFENRAELAKMAQFTQFVDDGVIDTRAVKEDYINFTKNRLFDLAEADGVSPAILAELEEEFDDVAFAEFSQRLGYPRFGQGLDPLLILAELPLPIYLTTSYHSFLEVALRRLGKQPRTEICRWHSGLEGIPQSLADDYQPTVQEPLVYHLHGLDTYPASLVLTEDDYMEFLVAISQNVGRGTDPIPRRVRQAMADSSLVLLGYNLDEWDFKVLFWGLIKPRPLQQTSVSIQVAPTEIERTYLQKYLDEFEFKVYFGTVADYLFDLRETWEG